MGGDVVDGGEEGRGGEGGFGGVDGRKGGFDQDCFHSGVYAAHDV